jgi:hypothetical protein
VFRSGGRISSGMLKNLSKVFLSLKLIPRRDLGWNIFWGGSLSRFIDHIEDMKIGFMMSMELEEVEDGKKKE